MRVTKIEITGLKQHCFDIEVEDVHEYLLDTSIVVHNSSKAAGVPNGWYPVRQTSMKKSDSSNIIDWTAPDSDLIGGDYQPAWGISQEAMIKVYAVIQKFTDQGISADLYADRSKTPDLSASAIIETALLMQRLGLKSRYYINSRTDSGETEQDSGCGSGGCKL